MEVQPEGAFLFFQVLVPGLGEFFLSFGVGTVAWSSMDPCGMRLWNAALRPCSYPQLMLPWCRIRSPLKGFYWHVLGSQSLDSLGQEAAAVPELPSQEAAQ